MIFKQFRFEPLGQASYLIGCGESGQAVVVDPSEDVGGESYILEAADLGLTITDVVETHIHADYVSAARVLAVDSGAKLRLFESASVDYPFEAMVDGSTLAVGDIELRCSHTPGHTDEHVAYIGRDKKRSEQDWFVLTGDSLLVGDVGRPDLSIGPRDTNEVERRSRLLYRSITERLMTLDDHVEVWPAHFGGSRCGGVNLSGKASSTIGYERKNNQVLQAADEDGFVTALAGSLRPAPDDHERIKSINMGLDPRGIHTVAS
ncbi:MAG: hydroxyacylglutathione hydrolase [Actinomycetota bacterium]|nr:hydroxyacylglutathione hydrolase [Actinomycetota bacterium]